MTIIQFKSKFPDEESAINYFIEVRYSGILICPHCKSSNNVYRYRQVKKLCHCKNCNNSFSPFKGTIFEKSSTPLWSWFFAIYHFLTDRKGLAAYHLERMLNVTYKTAFRMLHKIREAMSNDDMRTAFTRVVEMDETYVGGKPKYRLPSKGIDLSLLDTLDCRPVTESLTPDPIESIHIGITGRGTKKIAVVGIKERDTGRVYAQVMHPDELGKKLTGPQLKEVVDKICLDGTTIITDDFRSYRILDKRPSSKVDLSLLDDKYEPPRYRHLTVNHSRREYVAGRTKDGILIHTNGIESHWALFKRGYHGTYHSMNPKYLQRYLDEFCFRQNTLKHPDPFDLLLRQCILKS